MTITVSLNISESLLISKALTYLLVDETNPVDIIMIRDVHDRIQDTAITALKERVEEQEKAIKNLMTSD